MLESATETVVLTFDHPDGKETLITHANNHDHPLGVVMLELGQIVRDDCQVRECLDEELVGRLVKDIEANGLQYPLQVRPLAGRPNLFGVYDGWHRLAALQRLRAGDPETHARVPCQVRQMDDLSALVLSLNLNRERGELSAIELADALARLRRKYNLTWREVRERSHFEDDAYVRSLAAVSWNVCPGLREMNRMRKLPTSLLLAVATEPEETQLRAGRLFLEGRTAAEILRTVDPNGRGGLCGPLYNLRRRWVTSTGTAQTAEPGARAEAVQLREILVDWIALIDGFLAADARADGAEPV